MVLTILLIAFCIQGLVKFAVGCGALPDAASARHPNQGLRQVKSCRSRSTPTEDWPKRLSR